MREFFFFFAEVVVDDTDDAEDDDDETDDDDELDELLTSPANALCWVSVNREYILTKILASSIFSVSVAAPIAAA